MFSFLLSRKPYDPNDVLGIKVMVKEPAVRNNFIKKLEDNAPFYSLDLSSFGSFCDILVSTLDEATNDYDVVQRLYKLSQLFGTNYLPVTITCKSAFIGKEIFKDEKFWLHSAADLIKKDLEKWSLLVSAIDSRKQKQELLFQSMDKHEVNVMLILLRTQSIITSMKSLELSNEVIQRFSNSISSMLGFSEFNIFIQHIHVTKNFIFYVLDKMVDCFAISGGNLIYYDIHSKNGKMELKILKTKNKRNELGFCPIIEIIFSNYIEKLPSHYKQNLESKGLNGDSNLICICGDVIEKWSFTGKIQETEVKTNNLMIDYIDKYHNTIETKNQKKMTKYDEKVLNIIKRQKNTQEILIKRCQLPNILCLNCYRRLITDPLINPSIDKFINVDIIPLCRQIPTTFEKSRIFTTTDVLNDQSSDYDDISVSEILSDDIFKSVDFLKINKNIETVFKKGGNKSPAKDVKTHQTPIRKQSSTNSIPDDHSITPKTTPNGLNNSNLTNFLTSPLSSEKTNNSNRFDDPIEMVNFVIWLWDAIELKLVYSTKPNLVEKTRWVFLRFQDDKMNKKLSKFMENYVNFEVKHAKNMKNHEIEEEKKDQALDILSIIYKNEFFLCWCRSTDGEKPVISQLMFNSEHSLTLDRIKHIKVGSGRWNQCINIASDIRTLVMKIENQEIFHFIRTGLTALVANKKK